MKNTKIVLATFFLLFLTGIAIAGLARRESGLYKFGYETNLRPELLNQNFEIISNKLDRLADMVEEQEYEIRRLRSNESRLRYYIDYLYKSSTKKGVRNAEDWMRNILPEVENANRDLGVQYKR